MQVTRWRRYGKDRLYVRDDQGVDIGWWDLATDEGHPAAPDLEVALGAAVEAWRADASAAVDGDGGSVSPEDPEPPTSPPRTRPGLGAGVRAPDVTGDPGPAAGTY